MPPILLLKGDKNINENSTDKKEDNNIKLELKD